MYRWFFRHVLVGPTWLRLIEALALIAVIFYLLLLYVYPVLDEYIGSDVTVGAPQSEVQSG